MNVPSLLKESIARALTDSGIGISADKVSLEHPADLKNGDYSSGIAMQYAKQIGMAPKALAEKIVASLGAIEGIAKTEVAGTGFINFYLAPQTLTEFVETARTEDMWVPTKSYLERKLWSSIPTLTRLKNFTLGI